MAIKQSTETASIQEDALNRIERKNSMNTVLLGSAVFIAGAYATLPGSYVGGIMLGIGSILSLMLYRAESTDGLCRKVIDPLYRRSEPDYTFYSEMEARDP